jgi:hypothetical protein
LKKEVYTAFSGGSLLNASLIQTGQEHNALALRLEEREQKWGGEVPRI